MRDKPLIHFTAESELPMGNICLSNGKYSARTGLEADQNPELLAPMTLSCLKIHGYTFI